MCMSAIIDIHINSLNPIFQTSAKYDCLPLCMLLYQEYFPVLFLFLWICLWWKGLVFKLIRKKRCTCNFKTNSVLIVVQFNWLYRNLVKAWYWKKSFWHQINQINSNWHICYNRQVVFINISLFKGIPRLSAMYLQSQDFVYFSFAHVFW